MDLGIVIGTFTSEFAILLSWSHPFAAVRYITPTMPLSRGLSMKIQFQIHVLNDARYTLNSATCISYDIDSHLVDVHSTPARQHPLTPHTKCRRCNSPIWTWSNQQHIVTIMKLLHRQLSLSKATSLTLHIFHTKSLSLASCVWHRS